MTSAKRKILIAGMGTSPAVLTNVVWALAHQERFLGTPPFGLPNPPPFALVNFWYNIPVRLKV